MERPGTLASNNLMVISLIVGIGIFFAILIAATMWKKHQMTSGAAGTASAATQASPTGQSFPPGDVLAYDNVSQQPASRPSPVSFHEMIASISIPDPYQAAPARKPSEPDIGEGVYSKLQPVAPKVALYYVDGASVNVAGSETMSLRDLVKIDATGKIVRDLFCKACKIHYLLRHLDPAKSYLCPSCGAPLGDLVLPRDLKLHDVVKLDKKRLDCLEIIAFFFKEGYFTGSGRVYKVTIEKLNASGKIRVFELPALLDMMVAAGILEKVTRDTIIIKKELLQIATEEAVSKRVLELFDDVDERFERFQK
jgi:hypothetical protein